MKPEAMPQLQNDKRYTGPIWKHMQSQLKTNVEKVIPMKKRQGKKQEMDNR